MSALLWQPNLKQSFERNATLLSKNNLRVRLYSCNLDLATGPQNNPQRQVPSSLGQVVGYTYQIEFQKVL